jgi:hypothetical protein
LGISGPGHSVDVSANVMLMQHAIHEFFGDFYLYFDRNVHALSFFWFIVVSNPLTPITFSSSYDAEIIFLPRLALILCQLFMFTKVYGLSMAAF